jgi:hypothetical protein
MGFIFSFCVLALTLVANIAVAQSVASGAVSGQFEVTPLGSASYSIPISLPPGTAGMEPKLSLVYDSSENRGHFGMGWNLTGLSKITRCAPSLIDDNIQSGIEFSSTDRFCLDGQKLVAINGAYGADNTEYRTQIETFLKTDLPIDMGLTWWGAPATVVPRFVQLVPFIVRFLGVSSESKGGGHLRKVGAPHQATDEARAARG